VPRPPPGGRCGAGNAPVEAPLDARLDQAGTERDAGGPIAAADAGGEGGPAPPADAADERRPSDDLPGQVPAVVGEIPDLVRQYRDDILGDGVSDVTPGADRLRTRPLPEGLRFGSPVSYSSSSSTAAWPARAASSAI
jgi:hypothetical protein